MTYLVTFLCLLAGVLEGLIARIKRAVIALTPVVVHHTTGVYPVYTNGMFDGITTIVPLPSYHTRLTHAVHGYPRTSVPSGTLRHGYTHHADTPQYTKHSPTTVHCITNVIAIEVECLPSVDEQVQAITCHASFEGEPTPATTHRHIEAAAYVCAEVGTYDHTLKHEGMGTRNRAYKAHAHPRTKAMPMQALKPAYVMSGHTQAEVAQAILKEEQIVEMWAMPKPKGTLNTPAQLRYPITHPYTEEDLSWPMMEGYVQPVLKDIWWMIEQKRIAAEQSRGLCACGKALSRNSNMCYGCYIEQYRTYEEPVEIEDNWTAKDQEAYDRKAGVCLLCHQNPCCFDCVYDDDTDYSGVEGVLAGSVEDKVCTKCNEVIHWDGCLCQYMGDSGELTF